MNWIQRDGQYRAPRENGNKRLNQDETPINQCDEQAQADGDLDYVLAQPTLLLICRLHPSPHSSAC
jgi:hypothetical protein